MTKDKLMLRTVEELSEAVLINVLGCKIAYRIPQIDGAVFRACDGITLAMLQTAGIKAVKFKDGVRFGSQSFNITDPRHWMLVVDAMRENDMVPVLGFQHGGMVQVEILTGNEDKCLAYEYMKGEIGIAIGLAALRAKGIDCEWRPE